MISESPQFRARFWGVRGSYPTPGPETMRYGGNTSCVEIEVGGYTLILDAGSGIIRLGENLLRRRADKGIKVALFLTHGHNDHLLGLPFFGPLYEPEATIHFFAPLIDGRGVEELVTPLMSPPYFPVDIKGLPSRRTFHTLTGSEQIVWRARRQEPSIEKQQTQEVSEEIRVTICLTNNHPLNGAAIYKVEHAGRKLVFATDVEWYGQCDSTFLDFIEGVDILIHDAQYTLHDYKQNKRGFGHSSVNRAVEIARDAHVGKLVLFHHDPTYNDEKLDELLLQARQDFDRTYSAYEGMEIDL